MKMRALNDVASVKPMTDAERIESIVHARWCSADDYYVLQAKKQGKDFTSIAGELNRRRIEVEQRYHRLRSVKNIEALLDDIGLSDMRYCRETMGVAE